MSTRGLASAGPDRYDAAMNMNTTTKPLPTLRPSTGFGRTKLENQMLRVLRNGGNLPELRALAADEALLRSLCNLKAQGLVDDAGQLVPGS